MKKLLAALVLTLGTVTVAQTEEPKQDPNSPAMQEQKRNEGRNLGTGIDAADVDKKIGDVANKAEDKLGIDSAKDGTFKKDKAFSMTGTLKGQAFDGITLARQGLPDADLDVRKETAVMLDGKKVDLKAIPEGAQVRASFQLEGEEIVAVELKATTPKATKKTTK